MRGKLSQIGELLLSNPVYTILTIQGIKKDLDLFIKDNQGAGFLEYLLIGKTLEPSGPDTETQKQWMLEHWGVSSFLTNEGWSQEPQTRKILLETADNAPTLWVSDISSLYPKVTFTLATIGPERPFCFYMKLIDGKIVYHFDFTENIKKFLSSSAPVTNKRVFLFVEHNRMGNDLWYIMQKKMVSRSNTTLLIWEENDDVIFDFEEVRHYFNGFTAAEISAAYHNPEVGHFNGLALIELGDYERVFVTPDNKAFRMLTYRDTDFIQHPLLNNLDYLEWCFCSVYRDGYSNDDYTIFCSDLWKVRWIPSSDEEFSLIRMPHQTDFFEQYGYWPYFHDRSLMLLAELMVDGRKAFIFTEDLIDLVCFFEGDVLPLGVIKGPKPSTVLTYLEYSNDEPSLNGKYYIPAQSLPKTYETCQGAEFPEPGMVPIVQFPTDIRTTDKINDGDLGSVFVFQDENNRLHAEYTQT